MSLLAKFDPKVALRCLYSTLPATQSKIQSDMLVVTNMARTVTHHFGFKEICPPTPASRKDLTRESVVAATGVALNAAV